MPARLHFPEKHWYDWFVLLLRLGNLLKNLGLVKAGARQIARTQNSRCYSKYSASSRQLKDPPRMTG